MNCPQCNSRMSKTKDRQYKTKDGSTHVLAQASVLHRCKKCGQVIVAITGKLGKPTPNPIRHIYR